jgi:hypothetical protein
MDDFLTDSPRVAVFFHNGADCVYGFFVHARRCEEGGLVNHLCLGKIDFPFLSARKSLRRRRI